MTRIIVGVVLAVLIGIQLKPVARNNPAITGDVPASHEVKTLLRKACYDCHSNETRWPWYSYVAPVSWLVADDVEHARGHLNFSEWDKYTEKQRNHKLEEVVEEVEAERMPLWFYIPLHSEAKIKEGDLELLESWRDRSKMIEPVEKTEDAETMNH